MTALETYVDAARGPALTCSCGLWFRSATEAGALILLEYHTRTDHGRQATP